MAGMYGCFKGRNSDSAAMASGPPDVMANQEPDQVQEECSGKKKSKFQTFKKFFARKKRKEPSAGGADAGLKASQSSDNVSKTSENNTLTRSEKDKGSGSKISLGSKALSHDSVFVSDSSEANEALGASQDSIHGKVKSLQLQLKQAIRLGSPPSLMCVKKTEDGGTMSEDDGLPCSPPEYTTLHTVMNQAQRTSSISLEGMDSDDDQLSCTASSRAMSPLVVPGDFSQPASPFVCLDNSAAKHKLGLRHKACNKRKPASRLDLKTEGDSVDEVLNMSITEALEEQEPQKTEVVSFDEKPKVEREEEEEEDEEEEEEEEEEKAEHSTQSLLRVKEEREEGEDESEAEQDVSHSLDTSSPPEPNLLEEEAPDSLPLPSSKLSSRASSSKLSSRASSLDSPRATPEPPAGPREYLLDPPGFAYGAGEHRVESELAPSAEEDGVQDHNEGESSFLQEVLSSLKTPLSSCSLDLETEVVIPEMEETKEKEKEEEEEIEDGEEVELEEEQPVHYQAAPSGSLLFDHTTEEEEAVSTPSCQEEVAPVEEEEEEEEAAAEEEEELVVERFSQHDQEDEAEKEEAEEVEPEEENDMLTRQTDTLAQEDDSEREEEAIELEKEPQVEEEGLEKREEDEAEANESRVRVEEAEEVTEEEGEDAEEVSETFQGAAHEGAAAATWLQEADEGVDAGAGDDGAYAAKHASDDEVPAELGDQELAQVQEEPENCEMALEGEDVHYSEPKAEQEEDVEANQPDEDEAERESVERSHADTRQVGKDQTEAAEQATVSSKLPCLSLPESHCEAQSHDSGTISPSKTSTIHINLVSPSSEKAPSFFQQPPTAADVSESPSPAAAAAEPRTATAEEERADAVEEGAQSAPEEEATTPASVEETVNQPTSGSDQSKVRFTIAPAWQRSQSLTPPSSPPAVSPSALTAPGREGEEAEEAEEEAEPATKKDPIVRAEPASSPKVELVLSPGRARNSGSAAAKPQSNATPSPSSVKPQPSAAASAEESSVVVEGNPDNPFGVRLRKTSALHRFSSEEENAESPVESPVQPTSCKAEPPQPVSVKPSVSQPISNKPALPKKPDVHGDSGGKNKRISDPAAARGVPGGSDSPSWISMAKQKQRIYKENSLEEITVKKEEQERKSSLPMYVSSAASREQSTKTAESPSKASSLETSKPSVSVEKEPRRALSPPTPVPPHPSKAQSLPCPVPPKPQVPPATTKPAPQPNPAQRSLSPPTPVPLPQNPPSCTSPSSPSKAAASLPSSTSPQPPSTTATSAPFSSRPAPEKPGPRAPGLSGQSPSPQRGLPPAALPQDEPPWMALAKKKAKAWSEMPQIVQ